METNIINICSLVIFHSDKGLNSSMYHLLKHNLVLNWANMFFICRSSNDIFWYVIINREIYIYMLDYLFYILQHIQVCSITLILFLIHSLNI